jgi:iron complex transport system ATP-binding protein
MNILELTSVSYGRGNRTILSDVSLELRAGTVTALLGPNGAGKTTLLDVCVGWKKPASGSVTLEGSALANLSSRERGEIVSLVPQRENIRFDFSCLEYVLLGRSPYLPPLGSPGQKDISIAKDALAAAGIPHLQNRLVTEVSGGEYQLMLIARSLAQQTKLMLLDEPTSQLDPAHRIAVLRVLNKLSKRGMTVLLTSHSPETASLIADEICLLRGGRLAFRGPPHEVLQRENLESVYGVAFEISWDRGQPQFTWDLQDPGDP